MGAEIRRSQYSSLYTVETYRGERFLLVKPLTYMNRSGGTIRSWLNFHKIPMENLLVIYDEIDMDLGRIRLRESGSAGGHNGIKSIISSLGDESFSRLRLGIGPQPEQMDSADYVLQTFHSRERDIVDRVLAVVPDIVMCWSHEGMTQAMNRYNSWSAIS